MGLDEPVGVGGDLSAAARSTGLALAVDGEGSLQGLSLVVAGDTAVDVHIGYKTTAAALVLQTPGLATLDPMITLGLVVVLAGLDETDRLAAQLEADAARYGTKYLSDLSPEARRVLSDAVGALVAAVENLSDTAVGAGSGSGVSGYPSGWEAVPVGGPVAGVGHVAGVGQVAVPEAAAGERSGLSGLAVAVAGDCEPVWGREGRPVGKLGPVRSRPQAGRWGVP